MFISNRDKKYKMAGGILNIISTSQENIIFKMAILKRVFLKKHLRNKSSFARVRGIDIEKLKD